MSEEGADAGGDDEPDFETVPTDAGAVDDGAGDTDAADGDREDWFGDLLEDTEDGEPEDDPFAEAFEEVEMDEVDSDALWADLQRDDFSETVEDAQTHAERDVRVIEKRSYCQRCQYFADPPDTACTNEGTDILEVVDTEQFRVADCPIIRGEEELY